MAEPTGTLIPDPGTLKLRRRRRRREAVSVGLFLLPNLLGFLAFTAFPVLAAIGLAFVSWDVLSPPRFVGLGNFTELLGFHRTLEGWVANDPEFWRYLGNTLFMLLNLPINVAGSLILAMALDRKLRGQRLYRLVFFLPSILAGVAVYYLWRWLYEPDFGLFNAILNAVGIAGPRWLLDALWAKPAIMLMQSWMAVGGTGMILYLAALQGVPKELYEAAAIDGAGPWQRFLNVTWPSVRPVTFFIVTMGLIHGFQYGVDAIFVMTMGGPYGATTNLGFYIYRMAFVEFEMGKAATIALVLFAIILTVTLLHWRKGGRIDLA